MVLGARRVIWAQWIRFSITASLLEYVIEEYMRERMAESNQREGGDAVGSGQKEPRLSTKMVNYSTY